MQKLILSIVVAAFAVAAQAGENKEGACCASKAKADTVAAKGQCPASKEAKQAKQTKETRQALLSPKSQK